MKIEVFVAGLIFGSALYILVMELRGRSKKLIIGKAEPMEKQRLEVEVYHLRIAMKIAARNIDRGNVGQAKKNLEKALERES